MYTAHSPFKADWSEVEPTRRAATRASKYRPPERVSQASLFEALANTTRLPKARQGSFFSDADVKQAIPDMRLFYSGDLTLLDRPCVAIVGTRQVSEEGQRRTARLARELVAHGVVVVSGLAYGVDAVAHRTAIEAGGRTIAVIGTPLQKASPSENARLQEDIYSGHLLISQFEDGAPTYRTNFPLRNKLMATLTDATVVMEASDTSGTLHQAAECTKLGRWLFIARSVVEDKRISWPQKFLKYETCRPLDKVEDILQRVVRA